MTGDHNARNRAARQRLDAVIARLGDRDVALDDGWTAAALLAHLAFWDRVGAARIEKYLRDRAPMEFASDALTEYINAAGLVQWSRTPLRLAAADAVDAAAAIDRRLEGLSPEELAALRALGRPLLLDRSPHRDDHLGRIERALP